MLKVDDKQAACMNQFNTHILIDFTPPVGLESAPPMQLPFNIKSVPKWVKQMPTVYW